VVFFKLASSESKKVSGGAKRRPERSEGSQSAVGSQFLLTVRVFLGFEAIKQYQTL